MLHLPKPPSQFQKSLSGFPGRECRGIPALTHPSFALSLGGSSGLHITGLEPESTAAVYPSQWPSVGGVISTLEYKGYLVLGRAQVIHPGSPDWRSQGIVFTNNREGSMMIQRLEGAIFKSKEAAEKQGIELGKKWIDENPNKKA